MRHYQEDLPLSWFAQESGIFTPNLESLAIFGSMTTVHRPEIIILYYYLVLGNKLMSGNMACGFGSGACVWDETDSDHKAAPSKVL